MIPWPLCALVCLACFFSGLWLGYGQGISHRRWFDQTKHRIDNGDDGEETK